MTGSAGRCLGLGANQDRILTASNTLCLVFDIFKRLSTRSMDIAFRAWFSRLSLLAGRPRLWASLSINVRSVVCRVLKYVILLSRVWTVRCSSQIFILRWTETAESRSSAFTRPDREHKSYSSAVRRRPSQMTGKQYMSSPRSLHRFCELYIISQACRI